ncbi:LLM class flavin-dependent oxidoreductase [Kitasatospora xanthocidica]|uniref:LLM class flavin-dependent oxidoreductase n=1 Tax=Kitasatospora xanthocidica TaxID=83382 RepID=A0A373A6B6_9ACTN|nr:MULTISPECIES: LLM class flavin-dependent oxidoreductase [Streptomycetaceae]OKI03549.1 oxidoreductase [Streptomyces sp. CB02056]RGD63344.1 LLM class flavin-dependent oxidoreductase [Kitasatospora xanthocidica]
MTTYGISLLPDTPPLVRSAEEYYGNLLAVSELADDLGLEYVKMTEHYLHAYGGYCPDPLAFLSAVAARTSRVRLMTGGIQASFHHPIQLAARTAQLDALSGGRLDVGFARAFLPYEFDAFGIDLDSSKDRFRAVVDAVVRLWTESRVSEDTPFFRYRDADSLPLPTQDPHPPVWAAALITRSSFEWIGDSGYNLLIASAPSREQVGQVREMIDLYRQRFAAAPKNAGRRPQVAISVALYLADSDEEAVAEGNAALRRHWDTFGAAAESWRERSSTSYQGYREAMVDKHQAGPSEAAGLAVIGSPRSAVEQLRRIEAELGTDVVLFQLDYGQQSLESMSRSLKLFATEVRPRLGEAP